MNRGEKRAMRVLLQNTVTSLYFCDGQERWTPRFREAHDFGLIQTALDAAQRESLSDVQAVLVTDREGALEFMPLQIQALIQPGPLPVRQNGPWEPGRRD